MHARTFGVYRQKDILHRSDPDRQRSIRTQVGGSFVILFFLVALAGAYVFSINSNAVQGYRMRHLEQNIANMQEENARLRIQEADAKSFRRIEDMSGNLALEPANAPQYFEERDVVAIR